MSTDRSVCATPKKSASVLDEPWKVTLLPAAPAADGPLARKSLPWRMGDVTRLKDDSPEGMMKYIATHSTGWWQEMAERALRDTEKARRMAEEQGWQPGQYWQLEVDSEAREKVLAAEEARRVREEAERAKEEAEKEAFAKRQMELLEKAGRAPRCEYQYTDGRGCKAPQVTGERWCHGHAKMMSYRPEKLEVLPMEDEQAVMVNLYRVTKSLLSGRITEKVAGLTLWSIAIGAPGVARVSPQMTRRAQRKTCSPHNNAERRRSGRKISRDLTRINTEGDALRASQVLQSRQNRPLLQDDDLKRADHAARGVDNPGVTDDKSFKSGVRMWSTPDAEVKDSDSRENSLDRHEHNSHSRGPSTPPHSRCSLGVGRDDRDVGHRQTLSGVDTPDKEHSSVSPCLSGESELGAGDQSSSSWHLGETSVKEVAEIASDGTQE